MVVGSDPRRSLCWRKARGSLRIAVTGSQGQVALSLAERAAALPEIELVRLGRPEFDLLRPASVRSAILSARPDIVISAAAYTAVDQAEEEPDLAYAANVLGAGAVASAAHELGVPVLHLSTDYVFSGDKDGSYEETDEPSPNGVYASSKYAGELSVASANPRHVILRTAWVYSPFGKNFVKTMLRLAGERDEVSVVNDQWGNPTCALDIADGLLHIAAFLKAREEEAHFGVYHLAGMGETNWHGVARLVMAMSEKYGGPHAVVNAISTAQFPTRTPRPANSRLSTEKLARHFHWRAPHWRRSCEAVVRRLVEKPSHKRH